MRSRDSKKPCEHGQREDEGPCPACAEQASARAGVESQGAPLESETRARMESSFGFDFGSVRVHDGSQAASAADALDAAAFTVGRDVVLGQQAHPASRDHLLAHELAHVVQQGAREVPLGSLAVGRGTSAHEREAHAAAAAVGAGATARVEGRAAPMIQRAPKEEAKQAASPTAKAMNDDFENCSPDKKKEIQDRANEARIWVTDAHSAVRAVGADSAKPEVKELFARQFRFDPAAPDAKGMLSEVETSYAKMKAGTEKKLTFTCENRIAGRAAEAQSGFLSCAGHVKIFDDFFEEQLPGFEQKPEDIARDQKFRTHVLVHELAHNLAGREGEVRPGFTPSSTGCERQWPSWDQLGAKDAVNNAETYALFAQQLQDKK